MVTLACSLLNFFHKKICPLLVSLGSAERKGDREVPFKGNIGRSAPEEFTQKGGVEQ